MLERLTIRDLALVERAEIPFGPGLNALTGETGAGKTLVVQAMSLVVGDRAEADVIRDGAPLAVVEAAFHLEGASADRAAALIGTWGIELEAGTLLVRREVMASGRSRATVNETQVTIGSLKRLGELLADLHGQHEHQSLLKAEAGILTLDRLAGLEAERARHAETLAAWREREDALERLRVSLRRFAERGDELRHAAQELDDARLVEGESERLAADAARLAHADRLRALVGEAIERLSESDRSAATALGAAARALEQALTLDPGLHDALAAIREAEIAADEANRSLAGYADRLEADPGTLETIESRRELIARLTRKHRRSVPELLRWRAELDQELANAEDSERALAEAEGARAAAREACLAVARALSLKRRTAAAEWGPRISRELPPLGLGKARLEIEIESGGPEETPGPLGLDHVGLRFTPNPGEPARPLHKIASGGELSRVMLALKSALGQTDGVDLLVFDEVDAGIGGAVAQAVGERLRRLARHRQIVCVTHLPMIAALAQHHLRVVKHTAKGRTAVKVEPVEGDERVGELARMLAGMRATDTTRRQARELLEGAA